jgi:protoheme IX farnesyltransferase
MARVSDYVQLSKPRIGMLVVVSVGVAYWVATLGQPVPLVLLNVLMGTLLVASSASALNQWLEWRRDAMMARTANRPLPAERLSSRESLTFAALTLMLGGVQLLAVVGWQAFAWAFSTWMLYVCVYTPLKAITPLNTAVGAVVGAMPVLIGWSAAGTGYDLRAAAIFLILFLWQFPHFMSIAWMYRTQYATAGMRMMTVVDPSGRRAGLQAVVAAGALLPVSILPVIYAPGVASIVYGAAALGLGVMQLTFAVTFCRQLNDVAARRLLRASLLYLPIQLLLLVFVPWA